MGMDTVELVMALEDEFDIAIPNEDASNLAVVGDMFDYIVRELHNRGEPLDKVQLWERLRAAIGRQAGASCQIGACYLGFTCRLIKCSPGNCQMRARISLLAANDGRPVRG